MIVVATPFHNPPHRCSPATVNVPTTTPQPPARGLPLAIDGLETISEGPCPVAPKCTNHAGGAVSICGVICLARLWIVEKYGSDRDFWRTVLVRFMGHRSTLSDPCFHCLPGIISILPRRLDIVFVPSSPPNPPPSPRRSDPPFPGAIAPGVGTSGPNPASRTSATSCGGRTPTPPIPLRAAQSVVGYMYAHTHARTRAHTHHIHAQTHTLSHTSTHMYVSPLFYPRYCAMWFFLYVINNE